MRSGLPRLVRFACLAALASLPALALPASTRGSDEPRYLALGDSLATSTQTHPNGRHYRSNQGYSEYVWRDQRRRNPGLELVKLGRGGATAWEMLHAPGRPGVTQVEQAIRQIRAHHVVLITIDIGATEVENCRSGRGFSSDCASRGYRSIRRNVPAIVRRLRAAAGGRHIPIVGVGYYNYFLARWRLGRAGRAFARRSVPVEHRITRELIRAYRHVRVPVADVERAFDGLAGWPFVDRRRWGHVPLAVARVCDWTFACAIPFDDHANSRGYRVMGRATLRALGRILPRKNPADPATGGDLTPGG
jgi:lysophospholipase L1-like esterase